MVVFVGLNPSTADATQDDPTIRRCVGFADKWGYGGIAMVNLFAFRATDPSEMKAADDPVGPDNEETLLKSGRLYNHLVFMWGANGNHHNRDVEVLELLSKYKHKWRCLGVTKAGMPKHPLYLAKDTELVPYKND
jgi:hypothetical protein